MSCETDFKKIKDLSRAWTLVNNLVTNELNVIKRIELSDMGLVNSLINYLTKLRSLRHENVMKIEGIFL